MFKRCKSESLLALALACGSLSLSLSISAAAAAPDSLVVGAPTEEPAAAATQAPVAAPTEEPEADSLLLQMSFATQRERQVEIASALAAKLADASGGLPNLRGVARRSAQRILGFGTFVAASDLLRHKNPQVRDIARALFASPYLFVGLAHATSFRDVDSPNFWRLIENIRRSRAETLKRGARVAFENGATRFSSEPSLPMLDVGDRAVAACLAFALGDDAQAEAIVSAISRSEERSHGLIALLERNGYVSGTYIYALLAASHERGIRTMGAIPGAETALQRIEENIGVASMDEVLLERVMAAQADSKALDAALGAFEHWSRMDRLDLARTQLLLAIPYGVYGNQRGSSWGKALAERVAPLAASTANFLGLSRPARFGLVASHVANSPDLDAFGSAMEIIRPESHERDWRALHEEWKAAHRKPLVSCGLFFAMN
jgi:hypothetical protein